MDPSLLITFFGFGLSGFIALVLGIFFIVRGPKKLLHILFSVFNFLLVVVIAAHLYGITEVYDAELSRSILMYHLVIVFVVMIELNLFLGLIKKIKERIVPLLVMYAAGTTLVVYFLFYSHEFLSTSVLKLYFPNFYMASNGTYLFLWFVGALSLWALGELLYEYPRSGPIERNRILYMILSLVLTHGLFATLYFLFYDSTINPMPAAFFGVGLFPLAYVVYQYETEAFWKMLRRCIYYVLWIVVVTLLFTVSNALNTFLSFDYPDFQHWILPVVTGVVFVALGLYLWEKIHVSEGLKYEFITVVTHKFRTPLTYIKWSVDDLINKEKSKQEKENALEQISIAEGKLSELATTLAGLVKVEGVDYMYRFEKKNLSDLIHSALTSAQSRALDKHITISVVSDGEFQVRLDVSRMLFVLQILLENAITYTPPGGAIKLSLRKEGTFALFAVEDSGIGLTKEEMSKMFTKFFRSSRARSADTEGMGIGLYMAVSIVRRHKGQVWAESLGENKGTTFFVTLPLLS